MTFDEAADQSEKIGNPYIGPRPFSEEDTELYFGRRHEARDLLARVVSERLTLFYAQSGAGKSSLLHTRLIPGLREQERFWVLPVGRVSGEVPDAAGHIDNVYTFNLMASLDQSDHLPKGLAQLKLSDFLSKLTAVTDEDPNGTVKQRWIYRSDAVPPASSNRSPAIVEPRFVLIIDQFEEIISTHPNRWPDRAEFFRQLNQAMRDDPNLWVVLTLREDYVASLDPYRSLLDDKLRARFRMERMDAEAAMEAVTRPAELAGRPFAAGVAEKLVTDLSQIRVAGQATMVAGQYVEPVQLQVVCYQLWARITAARPLESNDATSGEDQITHADLDALHDINRALEDFYVNTIGAVLHDPAVVLAGVHERGLRTWFQEELITKTRIRDMILRNEVDGQAGSMPDVAVEALARRFLVRTEFRSGGPWVELVHDRFVEPIRANNNAWYETHVNPLTTTTQRWLQANRSPEHLLEGRELADAEAYSSANTAELNDDEKLLLAESLRERERQAKAALQRRLITVGAIVVAVIMAIVTAYAIRQGNEAKRQRDNAQRLEAQAWAVVAEQQLRVDPVAAVHVALASLPSAANPRPYVPASEFWLNQALQLSAETDAAQLSTDPLAPEQAALSPDGGGSVWIAAGSDSLRLAQVTGIDSTEEPVAIGNPTLAAPGSQDALAWNDEGRYLLRRIGLLCDESRPRSGEKVCEPDQKRTSRIEIFHLQEETPTPKLMARTAMTLPGRSQCAVWLPESADIALCQNDEVRLWSPLEDPTTTKHLTTMDSPTKSVVSSDDGDWLAVSDAGGNLTVIDVTTGAEYRLKLPDQSTTFLVGAWSPQAGVPTFAAGSEDGRILIWDSMTPAATTVIDADPQRNPLSGLAFYDADTFLTWGPVSPVRRWSRDGEMLETYRALPADEQVQQALLPPDGQQLLVFLADGTARLWSPVVAPAQSVALTGHRQPIVDADWHPSGQYVATVAGDGTARVWDVARVWDPDALDGVDNLHATEIATLYGHTNLDADSASIDLHGVRWLDGQRLLTWGEDGYFRIWAVLRDPNEQTCDGGSTVNGPQRGSCRQIVSGVRTPDQVQWLADDQLLTTSIMPTFLPERMEFVRHLLLNRLDLSSGEVLTTTLDAELLPEVSNRGYLAPPAATGRGALLPIQHSGETQGETVLSIIDGSADPVIVASLPAFTNSVRAVAIRDRSTVAAAHGDVLTVWNLENDQPTVRWSQPVSMAIATLAWSEDGRRLIVAGDSIELRDAQSGKVTWSWQPNPEESDFNADTQHQPYQVAMSEDGATLAVAQGRHVAVLPLDVQIAVRTPEPVWFKTNAHNDAIHGLAWVHEEDWPTQESVDSGRTTTRSLLLTWSGDGSARLWDWTRDAEIWRAQGMGSIEHATISPDGMFIATSYAPNLDFGREAPGGLRLWRRWNPAALREAAEAAASRPLSSAQQALIE